MWTKFAQTFGRGTKYADRVAKFVKGIDGERLLEDTTFVLDPAETIKSFSDESKASDIFDLAEPASSFLGSLSPQICRFRNCNSRSLSPSPREFFASLPARPSAPQVKHFDNLFWISWLPVSAASEYALVVDGKLVQTGSLTCVQISDLDVDSEHIFSVYGINSHGAGPASAATHFGPVVDLDSGSDDPHLCTANSDLVSNPDADLPLDRAPFRSAPAGPFEPSEGRTPTPTPSWAAQPLPLQARLNLRHHHRGLGAVSRSMSPANLRPPSLHVAYIHDGATSPSSCVISCTDSRVRRKQAIAQPCATSIACATATSGRRATDEAPNKTPCMSRTASGRGRREATSPTGDRRNSDDRPRVPVAASSSGLSRTSSGTCTRDVASPTAPMTKRTGDNVNPTTILQAEHPAVALDRPTTPQASRPSRHSSFRSQGRSQVEGEAVGRRGRFKSVWDSLAQDVPAQARPRFMSMRALTDQSQCVTLPSRRAVDTEYTSTRRVGSGPAHDSVTVPRGRMLDRRMSMRLTPTPTPAEDDRGHRRSNKDAQEVTSRGLLAGDGPSGRSGPSPAAAPCRPSTSESEPSAAALAVVDPV